MGIEIERKFLVRSEVWESVRTGSIGLPIRQGYLCSETGCTIRVRQYGPDAFLTLKGASRGFTRMEFEYSIPPEDAREMLENLCSGPILEKTRYRVPFGGLTWDVDVFEGANSGLILAEVELDHPDRDFPLPDWAGEEVTGDPRYYNSQLAVCPYRSWQGS